MRETRNDQGDFSIYRSGSFYVRRNRNLDRGDRAVKSYRDYLKKKQIEPMTIQRTKKRKGDKVLVSWAKPVLEVA